MSKCSTGEKVLIGGGAAVVVSLFLTWFSVAGLMSVSGWDGGSTAFLLLILGLGMAGLPHMYRTKKSKGMLTGAMVCAIFALLIVILNYPSSELGEVIFIGLGYWLAFLGSVAGVVGSVMMKRGK